MATATWNPVADLRDRYPGLADKSDTQILQHLSDPNNFRSEFPQYQHLSDAVIKKNLLSSTLASESAENAKPLPDQYQPTANDVVGEGLKQGLNTVPNLLEATLKGVNDIAAGKNQHNFRDPVGYAKRIVSGMNPLPPDTGQGIGKRVLGGAANVAGGYVTTAGLGELALPEVSAAAKLSPEARVNKLAYASGASGGSVDFPAAIQKVIPDLDKAVATIGKLPKTVADLRGVVKAALKSTNDEFNVALQPIASKEIVPTQVSDAIKGQVNSAMLKTENGQRLARILNSRAVEFEKPWTLRELNEERMNSYARLNGFEKSAPNSQTASLRTKADIIADKAVNEATRDVVYQNMNDYHGKDFGDLKSRQSSMLDLNDQLFKHTTQLSNAAASLKGAPLFSLGDVNVGIHPSGGMWANVGHFLQKTIGRAAGVSPESGANSAVQDAFAFKVPTTFRNATAVMLAMKNGELSNEQGTRILQKMGGKNTVVTRPLIPPPP